MARPRNHHRRGEDEGDEPAVEAQQSDVQEAPEPQVVPPYPMGVGVLRCQKQRHRDHVAAGGIPIYG